MIPANHSYEAVYEGKLPKPVVAWDKNGNALVIDPRHNELTDAANLPGFLALEKKERTVAALPPGAWVAQFKDDDDGSVWSTPLIGWAVHDDGTATPLIATADGLADNPDGDANFVGVHHPAWDKDKS